MSDKVVRITFGPGNTKITTASNIIDGSGAYDRMRSERDHYRDKYHEAMERVAELEVLKKAVEDWMDICGCCCESDFESAHDGRRITRLGIKDALQAIKGDNDES